MGLHRESSGRPQHRSYCDANPLPVVGFEDQLLATFLSQRVKSGSAIIRGLTPPGPNPASPLHAIEGRIDRALLDPEEILGQELDPLGYTPTVQGTGLHNLQHQQVKGALQKIRFALNRSSHRMPMEGDFPSIVNGRDMMAGGLCDLIFVLPPLQNVAITSF
jgi:hypothetical protein